MDNHVIQFFNAIRAYVTAVHPGYLPQEPGCPKPPSQFWTFAYTNGNECVKIEFFEDQMFEAKLSPAAIRKIEDAFQLHGGAVR
jgi:hypothetical protein